MTPQTNEIYKHFKGNLYKIVTLAKHSETGEDMVVYQALYGNYDIFVRPLNLFVSDVDTLKYPNVTQQKRFELVSEAFNVHSINEPAPKDVCTTISEDCSSESCDSFLKPEVESFLDAYSIEEKRDILISLHNKTTTEDITIMSTVMDIEIDTSLEYEERYNRLLHYLNTRSKFETSRLQ